MPDITQRIADILRRLDEESTGGDLSSRSSTGPEQWAEVLTTELGLTREYQQHPEKATVIEGGCTFLPISSRYVTGWVPDE